MKNKKALIIILVVVAFLFLCFTCSVGTFFFYSLSSSDSVDEGNSLVEDIIDDTSPEIIENEITAEHQECYDICASGGSDQTGVEICYDYCDASYLYEEDGVGMEEACDDSGSDFSSLYRNERLTVIENPCEVIWLLAQEEESFTVQTKNGTTIYVTVWRDWENNTTPGTTFTIRGLDVEDSSLGIEDGREDAEILIVRWVESEADLAAAKNEVREAIEGLDF